MSAGLFYCDCCKAPMIDVTHYGAGSTSAGCETAACLLCAGMGDRITIVEEINELGRYIDARGVADRIIKLGDLLPKAAA